MPLSAIGLTALHRQRVVRAKERLDHDPPLAVEVLLRIYAKCLDGDGEQLRQRIKAALGHKTSERIRN